MTKTTNDLEGQGKKQKKYMWLGFGDYSIGEGQHGFLAPGNVRLSPGIFDRLFELFGLKEKTKYEKKEASEEERDPSW